MNEGSLSEWLFRPEFNRVVFVVFCVLSAFVGYLFGHELERRP